MCLSVFLRRGKGRFAARICREEPEVPPAQEAYFLAQAALSVIVAFRIMALLRCVVASWVRFIDLGSFFAPSAMKRSSKCRSSAAGGAERPAHPSSDLENKRQKCAQLGKLQTIVAYISFPLIFEELQSKRTATIRNGSYTPSDARCRRDQSCLCQNYGHR